MLGVDKIMMPSAIMMLKCISCVKLYLHSSIAWAQAANFNMVVTLFYQAQAVKAPHNESLASSFIITSLVILMLCKFKWLESLTSFFCEIDVVIKIFNLLLCLTPG